MFNKKESCLTKLGLPHESEGLKATSVPDFLTSPSLEKFHFTWV